MGFARSAFRGFESYLRIVVGLDQDDIQLLLQQFNSIFITYEIPPSSCSIKDVSDVVYTMGDYEGTLQIENHENFLKTQLISTRFGGSSGTLSFNEY